MKRFAIIFLYLTDIVLVKKNFENCKPAQTREIKSNVFEDKSMLNVRMKTLEHKITKNFSHKIFQLMAEISRKSPYYLNLCKR